MIQLVILLIVCLCCCSCVGGALNAIEDSLEKKAENAAKKNEDTFNNLDGQVNRNDNIKWYN